MLRHRLFRSKWLLGLLLLVGASGIYFYLVMQEALRSKRAKLVEIYQRAKRGEFDSLEYEIGSLPNFRNWKEERGPIDSFKITGAYLWLPIWGEIYGTVCRRGIPYRVVGLLESDQINYFNESELGSP